MIRRFTGWHMTVIFVAFFAVVIAVNLIMATYASTTFGGTVVENSYVASQRYNDWLARARAQALLGWTPTLSADASRHVQITIATPNGSLSGAKISATATHPLGGLPPRVLTFVANGDGYRSLTVLPPGRWLIRLEVERQAARAVFDDELAS